MNEVTKLYENANIKAKEYCDRDSDACMTCCPEWENRQNCWKYKSAMPPFTAEKQIAILNFCLKWGQVHLLRGFDDEYRIENCCYRQGYQPTIADAIANYINEKWEKLTPEERKQIKEVLNG